jgi:hypothetical protein
MTQDEIANDASYSKAASDSRYINYDGDIVNGTIQMGGSGNNITFADNNKAVFGDDSDLQIYHDNTGSYVKEGGTGSLYLQGTDVRVQTASGENILNGTSNGAVTLYHDNSPKIATTSAGIDVTGIVTATGNITAGSSTAGVVTVGSANGFEIQKSGVNGYINQSDNGPIIIRMGSAYSEKIRIDSSGNVGIGTSNPFTKFHAKDTGWSSGAPYGSVSLIEGNNVNDNNWGHLVITDTTTTNGSGGSIRFATGAANALNPFSGIQGTAEGASWGGIGFETRPQSGTATRRMTIDSTGNVGVGTSTQTHKLEVAGTTKAEQYLLDAVAKDISDTAVDVFIYDTRKDSDGGAWRKRTQHTSWYNETLNTATRGARKEFPAVAVIVAEINQVTIYDGDDPDLPMWMVFNQGGAWSSSANLIMPTSPDPVSISFLNGILSIAYNSGYGVGILDFISESKTTIFANNVTSYNGNVSQRNGGLGHSSASDARRIVNSATNDVAMTILPNAPIDAATGLPVPTIAVATNGGVSVIKDNGTVVDITAGAGSNYSGASFIDITENYNLIFEQDSSSNSRAVFCIPIPEADRTTQTSDGSITDKVIMKFYPVGSHVPYPCFNGGGVVDAIRMAGDNQALKSEPGDLTLLEPNLADPELGKVAYIASDYNTGWMNGDIKLATLSDTDDTDVTGSELVTNGTFDSDLTGWNTSVGTSTWNSGTMHLTNTTQYGTEPSQIITGLTVGSQYVLTFNKANVSGDGSWYIDNLQSTTSAAGTFTYTITATSTSYTIRIKKRYAGTISIDNVSFRLAEEDRSVNGNGLQVFGTVTKSKGGSDRDIVSYGGFDSGDYLQQPYNSSLDFSGDFCIQTWMYIPSDTTAAAYHYGYTLDQDQAILALYVAGQGLRTYTRESGGNWNYIQSSVVLNSWIHVTHQRKSGIVSTSINGILTAGSYTHTANLTRSGNVITLGRRIETTQTTTYWRGSLSLFRLSNTALSQEQIKKIYNDEKFLFQENAKATLYGSSDAVTALAYDDDTELLHVGTSAGRSVFQGLRRIDNTTDAVGAAISASNGMVAED